MLKAYIRIDGRNAAISAMKINMLYLTQLKQNRWYKT